MHERIYACAAVGLTLAMSELGVLSLIIDPSGATIRKVAARWGKLMVRHLGVRLHVSGGEAVDWNRPMVVMVNHNSHLDIPVLYASLPRSFGMLAKKELFEIPIFGRAMRGVGCVPIDRDDKTSTHASIKRAARHVRDGESIVVFPEGTRGDGHGIRPLKSGPFVLAQAARVPIVPVGIAGTAAIIPRHTFLVRPGDVHVAIGEPIATHVRRDERPRLVSETRAAIAALAKLPLIDA